VIDEANIFFQLYTSYTQVIDRLYAQFNFVIDKRRRRRKRVHRASHFFNMRMSYILDKTDRSIKKRFSFLFRKLIIMIDSSWTFTFVLN